MTELEQQLQDANNLVQTLRRKVEDERDERDIPVLREKYEGKYFKYKNSYGVGSGNEYWFIYSYCHEIKSTYRGVFSTFEIIPNEGCKISIKQDQCYFLCQTEIPKDEYDVELAKLTNQIQKLSI